MKVGINEVTDILIGETPIVKVYRGEDVIWERGGLPSGYTRVEYLESTGTQYIITDIYHNELTTIECEVSLNNLNATRCIYGSRTANGSKGHTFLFSGSPYNNNIWTAFFNQNLSINRSEYFLRLTKYKIINGPNGCYVNETLISNYTFSGTYTADYPIVLFTFSTAGAIDSRTLVGKMYSFKVDKNGIITNNLVPCLDNNNRPCMYDLVTKQTFYNQGTGQFGYETMDGTIVAPI